MAVYYSYCSGCVVVVVFSELTLLGLWVLRRWPTNVAVCRSFGSLSHSLSRSVGRFVGLPLIALCRWVPAASSTTPPLPFYAVPPPPPPMTFLLLLTLCIRAWIGRLCLGTVKAFRRKLVLIYFRSPCTSTSPLLAQFSYCCRLLDVFEAVWLVRLNRDLCVAFKSAL